MRATLKHVDGTEWSIDTNSWQVIAHWLQELTKDWQALTNHAVSPIRLEIRP